MDLGTILSGQFEPESLTPGRTYTAFSDDVAYPILRYMVTAGFATSLWEQFLPEGRVAMTAVAGRENPEGDDRPVEATGRMTLTQKWARDNVLNDYVNWREAWWREAIQNSVDASATRVKLSAAEQEDGTWLIVADDNGTGMSQQQMEDPEDGFLVFGGSSKARALGQTGAFGKAKELLVLPWIRWKVETRDKSYSGAMDEWERRSIPYRSGLRVEVVMPADFHTDNNVAMAFLEKCWIPNVNFVLNGSRVTTKMPVPTDPDALIQTHDMAAIYRYKRERSPQIYVRKNGIWMFSIDLPPQARESILVEVTADSKKAFTQSRDSFQRHTLYYALEDLKAELTVEKKILPRRDQLEEMDFYNDRDMSFVAERAARVQLAIGNLPPITKAGARFDSSALKEVGTLLNEFIEEDLNLGWTIGTTDPGAGLKMCDLSTINGQKSYDALVKQLVWFQDFKIIKYPKQPLVKKRFMPGHMDAKVYRLARVWSQMCRAVLMMLGCEREYGIGFVFWNEAAALCARRPEKTYLLINPYASPSLGTEDILDPSRSDHLRSIYGSAVHECTHFWDGVMKHDDSFAGALNRNFEQALIGERDLFKLTSAIKKRRAPNTSEPKARGGGQTSEKRKEKLYEMAKAIGKIIGTLKYDAYDADVRNIVQFMKVLGAKPTPAVEETLESLRKGNYRKGSEQDIRALWKRCRTLGNWDEVSVMRFDKVSVYWSMDRETSYNRVKMWIRPDGTRLVRLWNQMVEYMATLPDWDGSGDGKSKPYDDRHLEFAEASLMFPDWDADKAPDKGKEEYEAAARAAQSAYHVSSLIQQDYKIKAKAALVGRFRQLTQPGSEYLGSSEQYIREFIRALWPYDLEEDTGKYLSMTDDVIRSIVNQMVITNKLVTPWFEVALRWVERGYYASTSIVCANSTVARRWELMRTRYMDHSWQMNPAEIDVDFEPNMRSLPAAVEHWKVLSSLIGLAIGLSKNYYPDKPKFEQQIEAMHAVFQYLGAESVTNATIESMLPILAEYGMVGTPTGDDLAIVEGDGGQPAFVISLAPAGERATQRWATLRTFYDALEPKNEYGLQWVADLAFEPGTVQQLAAASPTG